MENKDHTVQGYLERCSTEEIKQVLKEGRAKFGSDILDMAKRVLLKRKKLKIPRCKVKISKK